MDNEINNINGLNVNVKALDDVKAIDSSTNSIPNPNLKPNESVRAYVRGPKSRRVGYVYAVKNPTQLARRFKARGLIWEFYFADAIKAANDSNLSPKTRTQAKADIAMWLRLIPFLVTSNKPLPKMRKWTGKASHAAKLALEAMEKDVRVSPSADGFENGF